MKLSFWDILASMVMLAGLALATIFINIFINPYTFINPFPPPTPVAALNVPTLTPSPRSLPELWTGTPETPGAQLTFLALNSATPSPTASMTGTRLVLPTGTPTRTITKTRTSTPNKSLTSAVIKTAAKTSTSSSSSSDTTKPTTPGKPSTSSSTTDGTPTYTWTASTDAKGIDYYEIYWNTSNSCGGTLYTGSSSNSWTKSALSSEATYYVCVRAVDDAGNKSSWSSVSNAWTFVDDTNPTDPGTPTTSSATTDTTPTFTWTASTDSGSGIYGYEVYWGTVNACGATVSTRTVANYTPAALTSNGTYYICVRARDRVGLLSNNIGPVPFTLNAALAPSATTIAADGITTTAATLHGTINANNASTTVTFQYGTTTSYGTTVSASPGTVTGDTNTSVSAALAGLAPNTTYHFRVRGVNSVSTTNGSDLTFITDAIPSTTTITSDAPDPSVVGQAYSVGVTVAGSSGTPTGTVSVSDGTVTCSITLSGGSGSCNLTSTSVGAPKTITATYSGNSTYSTSSDTETHTVNKADPTVSTWPTATAITYGQTLANSALTGGSATPPGTFAFTTPATAPVVGTASHSVTFTPTDTTNYNTVTGSANVTVNKANPTITTWPSASDITYGQTLADSTLSGEDVVTPGTFDFTTPSTAPDAGTASHSVTFTPTDTANYNTATQSVSVTVNKADPIVNDWPTASAITYGQPLSASSLTGGDTTPSGGSFAFTSSSTVPDAGTANQNVTYSPADTANYNTVTGPVSVTVNQANTTATITTDLSSPTIAGDPYTVAVTVAVNAPGDGTPTGNITVSDGTDTCTITLPTGSCDLTSTTAGAKTITATYAGDSNFNGSSDSENHTVN